MKFIEESFFFPLEVPRSVAEMIAKEVGERCSADAQTSVRAGTAGWFINIKARTIRESNKAKIYPFLYGVEFALRRSLL